MVTFYLPDKDRKRSIIYLLVSFRKKRYARTTGESTLVSLWNLKKKRVKILSGDSISNITNDVLDKLTAATNDAIAYYKEYKSTPSKEEFFKTLDNFYYKEDTDKKEQVYLTDYMSLYINRYKNSKSISCIKKYVTTRNKILQYERLKKKRLLFEDINIDFYNDFKSWFFGQGFSTNYFGNTIKTLKLMHQEAQYIDNMHTNPIMHKGFIGTREDTESVYLTEEELKTIFDLQFTIDGITEFYLKQKISLDKEQARKKVVCYNMIRDRFLIGAYTGLRVSDFGRLHEANIQGDFIRLRTLKTDTKTVIPMNSKVKEIITHTDLSKTVSDQKINKHIKEICNMAGIDDNILIHKSISGKRVEKISKKYELVCTHTARRSFATNAYKAGVPTIAIMKITGHTKESTFLKYIKVSMDENAETLLSHAFFK